MVIDRFVISPKSEKRISESVHMALEMADGNLILGIQKDGEIQDKVFSKNLYDPESGLSYEDPAPNLFSLIHLTEPANHVMALDIHTM